MGTKKHFFTAQEIEQIAQCYPDMRTDDLAKQMGFTVSQVYDVACKNQIKKSVKYKREVWQVFKCNNGLQYRYKKGNIPANKGKKMPSEIYEKCQATMFKKGYQPHNAKYDGYERISVDGYLERRVSKGKFRKVQQIVWEQHNGPIPKGMIVVFRDGNPLNCALENLEMITRRENMDRNTMHRFPPEIKELIRINGNIKRRINGKKQNV